MFTEDAAATSWSICTVFANPVVFNEPAPSIVKVSFALSTLILIEPLSVAIFLNISSAAMSASCSLIAPRKVVALVFKDAAPISASNSLIAPRKVLADVVSLPSRFISESSF